MPNNRVKTTKALQSKKGKAVLSKLHPHSRRAKQINRIALRDDKLALNKKEKKKQGNALTSRLIWFIEAHKHASGAGSAPANDSINVDQHQHQQPPEPTSDDLAHLHTLINRFIARNSAQITHEVTKRKNGQFSNRPKSAAQEKLESLARAEMIEYATNGFVLPDLRTPENLKLLDEWKDSHRCDRSFLARVKLIRLFKDEPARVVEEQRGAIDSFRLTSSGLDGPSDNGQDSQDDDSDEDVQLIEVDS
ncbi:hypothetical protein PCANC_16848 [Puccinia coronata f. sp. avenae]|uniref:Translation machinery-associated protein 16 n=1 Tax=Puccinia coronata f. sp. avenae TaxID=200324 RepID=A0A2N5SEX8_9BASI|nr:hypothetical protein PCASD_21562 [Puccinia coronata f. sp. avenae]PLW16262.1 hypothetical protein PCANC_16848 [Puccinia coronata f. sp. avenae]